MEVTGKVDLMRCVAAHEAAEHTARLRVELAQSKHEQADYIRQVELAKSYVHSPLPPHPHSHSSPHEFHSIEKRAASKQKKPQSQQPQAQNPNPDSSNKKRASNTDDTAWSNVYEGPAKKPRVVEASEESVRRDKKLKEVLGKIF